MMTSQQKADIEMMTNLVAQGKVDADCARTELHIRYCEECREKLHDYKPKNRDKV